CPSGENLTLDTRFRVRLSTPLRSLAGVSRDAGPCPIPDLCFGSIRRSAGGVESGNSGLPRKSKRFAVLTGLQIDTIRNSATPGGPEPQRVAERGPQSAAGREAHQSYRRILARRTTLFRRQLARSHMIRRMPACWATLS